MEKPFCLFTLCRAFISHRLWGTYQPPEFEILMPKRYEFSLSLHRQQSEKKIAQLNLPTPLQFHLTQGLLLLEQAYNDAFDWLNIYEKEIQSLKYHKLDIIHDSHYRFRNFITPRGEFDDLNWIKQFVNDEQQMLLDRFFFACFYCFEEKIRFLWPQLLDKGWIAILCNKDYKAITFYFPTLVSFWIHYIEGKQAELLGSFTPPNLFHYGFTVAINAGNEKAVHYFWDELSKQEHTSPLNDIIDYAKTICGTAYQGYPKILHFLYSRLNPQQQQSVLQYDLQKNRYPSIWCCHLQPSLISFIPEQIKLHQSSLPPKAFSSILFHLACKITEIRNPVYQQIFHTVWKLGSPENKNAFSQDDQGTLSKLLNAKEFACARELLKGTPIEQKKKLLFISYKRFWITDPSYQNNPSAIRNYFLLFLTDLHQENTTSQLMPFHADSLNLLEDFRERSYFAKRYLNISKEYTLCLLSTLENIKLEIETSDLLKSLLQKIESSIENKQPNPVKSLSQFGLFSTPILHKRTHSDEQNSGTSEEKSMLYSNKKKKKLAESNKNNARLLHD